MNEPSDQETAFLERQAAVRQGWGYGNRFYRERTEDTAWLMREALRRAVDLRDQPEGANLGARGVMLVDVLNALYAALGYDDAPLWADWDR